MLQKYLHNSWLKHLQNEINEQSFVELLAFIENAYATKAIFPPKELVFNAFYLCPFEAVKVVIIGQDPYHGPGQANGLAFSVSNGIKVPPSLKNIFKELNTDVNAQIPVCGNLENWAKQGVLLLNTILTVEQGLPGSHRNKGWEVFTDAVIKHISSEKEHVVFLLWGNYAIQKENLIDSSKHLILKAAHPSPLARGAFFGCKHFSTTNSYLVKNSLKPIDWGLEKKTLNLF